jgi:hypothetical protein
MSADLVPAKSTVTTSDEDVLFGRSRLLKLLGAGLFTFAVESVKKTNPAWATHVGPPGPCYGFQQCDGCSGSQCTLSTCGYYHYEGCPTGGQCWSACYSNCTWHCCDWMFTVGSTWNHCLCGTCVAGSSC